MKQCAKSVWEKLNVQKVCAKPKLVQLVLLRWSRLEVGKWSHALVQINPLNPKMIQSNEINFLFDKIFKPKIDYFLWLT